MRSVASVVVSIVVLCARVWTPGCEDLVGEVRDTYAQYMKAKDDQDAATVLAWVAAQTERIVSHRRRHHKTSSASSSNSASASRCATVSSVSPAAAPAVS